MAQPIKVGYPDPISRTEISGYAAYFRIRISRSANLTINMARL